MTESTRAAAFGGPGFLRREAAHPAEVAQGVLWRRCGYAYEADPLREVLLKWPGLEAQLKGQPDGHLYLRRVSLRTMRLQCRAVRALYESHGVHVHVQRFGKVLPPPNTIFLRDLFIATPEGVILGRMASKQRAGEERFAAWALATMGVPLVGAPRGQATLEGADVLWLTPRRALVGVGNRTNSAGFDFVQSVLRSMGVDATAVQLPVSVQHLLGTLNFVSRDFALLLRSGAASAIAGILRECGVRAIEIEPSEEVTVRRGLNFVALSPNVIAMPAGCPLLKARLAAEGTVCHEVDVSEYIGAGGGLGCLTGVLRRDDALTSR